MARKNRQMKANPAKRVSCDKCELEDPSGIAGAPHRRCGGGPGKPRQPKHARVAVKGRWR